MQVRNTKNINTSICIYKILTLPMTYFLTLGVGMVTTAVMETYQHTVNLRKFKI